jgi:uncharacterized protein (TIGR02246 family)
MMTSMDNSRLENPDDIARVFINAWNDRDADRLASVFDEDAEFVNVTGLWWHDRESIRKAHAYGLSRIFNHSTLRIIQIKVKRLSEDIAVVHARMALTSQTPTTGIAVPRPRTTIFSFVVHRNGEGWWCPSAHNTDVIPGMETNIIDEKGELRPVNYRTGKSGP